jgi:RNA polymerase sigma factor for flagellar operon FliA
MKKAVVTKNDKLIQNHMPLVYSIANNIRASIKLPAGIGYEDLISFGTEGLIKAYESFDSKRGVPFGAFATFRVRGEILDRLRKEWKYRTRTMPNFQERVAELAEEILGPPKSGVKNVEKSKIEDLISSSAVVYLLSSEKVQVQSTGKGMDDPGVEIIEKFEFTRQREIIREAIEKMLDQVEKRVLNMMYDQDLSQRDVAKALDISTSKVNRVHTRLISKLRDFLKSGMQKEEFAYGL